VVISDIKTPVLLLDEAKCRRNIQVMAEKAGKYNLHFRPHFKTHQSAIIAEWFREEGTTAITVSSVRMAKYFANHGWNDITIAFPVNLREMEGINQLASEINLNLLLGSEDITDHLTDQLKTETSVFIEIDTGARRSGIQHNDIKIIECIIDAIRKSPLLNLSGFLTHAGHTYHASNKNDVLQIHQESLLQMHKLKTYFATEKPMISIGDTPSCTISDDFDGADEIRPGNFVFYDLMQARIGSCRHEQIAVALACPVVAKYPGRSEIIIYGGAVHFSKDSMPLNGEKNCYGRIAFLNGEGWNILPDNNMVIALSQEHGVVKMQERFMKQIAVGDLLAVLPVHSCLTAHQMGSYLTLDKRVIHMMDSKPGV
jgi:D-serine deaminase-like pyridoxal phosphate-dependent protein